MTDKKMTTAQRLEQCHQILMVRHFDEDGTRMIRVPLCGKNGTGLYMVLKADVWHAGRAAGWPADWYGLPDIKTGKIYVATSRSSAGRGGTPTHLARLIANAGPDEVVAFKDGDTLNLRSNNLQKMSRADFAAHRRTLARGCREFVEMEEPDEAPAAKLPWEE